MFPIPLHPDIPIQLPQNIELNQPKTLIQTQHLMLMLEIEQEAQ